MMLTNSSKKKSVNLLLIVQNSGIVISVQQDAYEKSVGPNRKQLMKYIGVEDKSQPYISYNQGIKEGYPQVSMQKISSNDDPQIIAETDRYRVFQVRWPVLNGVYGEGLLLQPKSSPVANIIAIPDADQTPEQLAGLSSGNTCQISVCTLFSRKWIPGTDPGSD